MTEHNMKTSRRTFTVAPGIIRHLIESQAGTHGKAVQEAICNGIDAGATSVHVTIPTDGRSITISDDGKGWESESEIEETFGCFGFDHESETQLARNVKRIHGRFGLGRAQIFSFASAKYTTNQFVVSVDVRANGLDYDLEEHPAVLHKGCRIEATLYERLMPSEIDGVQREIRRLSAYSTHDVYLNGKRINKRFDEVKWTFETDAAQVLLDSSSQMSIYSLGIFVCSKPANEYGSGGVINSTKQPLLTNMARNDILVAKCAVWKAIQKEVRKRLNDHMEEKGRSAGLNTHARYAMLSQWNAGAISFAQIAEQRVLTTGRGTTLQAIRLLDSRPYTVAPEPKLSLSEFIANKNIATVYGPELALALGVGPSEPNCTMQVHERLVALLRRDAAKCSDMAHRVDAFVRYAKPVEFSDLRTQYSSSRELLPATKLTKRERAIAKATQDLYASLRRSFYLYSPEDCRQRSYCRIFVGSAQDAVAWTDCKSYIAVDREFMLDSIKAEAGVHSYVHTMVHEMLHDEPSLESSHAHTSEFYESFHDRLTSPQFDLASPRRTFIKSLEKALTGAGERLPSWLARATNDMPPHEAGVVEEATHEYPNVPLPEAALAKPEH